LTQFQHLDISSLSALSLELSALQGGLVRPACHRKSRDLANPAVHSEFIGKAHSWSKHIRLERAGRWREQGRPSWSKEGRA